MAAIYDGVNDYRKRQYEVFGKPYRYDDGLSLSPPPPLGPVKTKFENKNGIPITDDAGTVWHLIANNITGGGSWPSTVGGLTATGKFGGNSAETPFYPGGQFNGINYNRASTQFSPANYFTQTYSASLDFTAATATNFIIVFRTGDFSRNETLLSRYIAASANHNCRVWTTTAGEIKFKVGCDVTDSVATVANLEPYTYYYVYFYWNGATLQTYINVSGTITNFALGVGNVINDGTSSTRIGNDASVGTDYALTSQILEIWRSDTIVPSLAALKQMIRVYTGLQPTVGTDPTFCYRATSAEILVNNNLWRMGPEMMRMSYLGYLVQDQQVGELLNSTFTAILNPATDWITTTAGSTSVSRINSSSAYSGIGAQCVEFIGDIAGNIGNIANTSNTNFTNGTKIWFSFDYKSTTATGRPYYSIQNASTLDWYNAATDTWAGVQVYNPLSVSGTVTRAFVGFTMNANGQLNVNINTGPFGSNISQSFEIYHTQIDTGELLMERIVSRDSYKTKDPDITVWPDTLISRYVGAMTFSCALSSAGNTSTSVNRSLIGGSSTVAGVVAGNGRMVFRDVLNNSTYGSTAYVRLELDDYTVIYDWNVPTQTMKSTALGVNTTLGAFVGIQINPFGIGQNGTVPGSSMFNGYIKNFTSYGV